MRCWWWKKRGRPLVWGACPPQSARGLGTPKRFALFVRHQISHQRPGLQRPSAAFHRTPEFPNFHPDDFITSHPYYNDEYLCFLGKELAAKERKEHERSRLHLCVPYVLLRLFPVVAA